MKINKLILDERIQDDTVILIRDTTGKLIVAGYWFSDEIISWGSFSATFEYSEDENIAICQLI